MEHRKNLNLDEMAQVIGDVNRTINTGTSDKAQIRTGPGTGFGRLVSLMNGTVVNTVTDELVWDEQSGRHFVEVQFTGKDGKMKTGWIASSIVGMKR